LDHLDFSIAQVMRNSGCEVPDYMLELRKTSKSNKKKLAQKVPARKRISTELPMDKKRRERRQKRQRRAEKAKSLANGQGPLPKKHKTAAADS